MFQYFNSGFQNSFLWVFLPAFSRKWKSNQTFRSAKDRRLVKLPMENRIQSWLMKLFFLTSGQLASWQGTRDWGEGLGGWDQGLGLAGQRGITSSQSEDGGKKIPSTFGGSEKLYMRRVFPFY